MTDFTGPVRVRRLDSQTTAIELHAGGSAHFTDRVVVSGDLVVSGNIQANAADHQVMFVARTTVNAQTNTAAATITIPTGSHIHNIEYMLIGNHFGTAAADVNILIGTSADDNEYCTIAASGGAPAVMSFFGPVNQATTVQTQNFTGISGLALHSIASDTISIKTTAVSGTVSSKNALLSFFYSR